MNDNPRGNRNCPEWLVARGPPLSHMLPTKYETDNRQRVAGWREPAQLSPDRTLDLNPIQLSKVVRYLHRRSVKSKS